MTAVKALSKPKQWAAAQKKCADALDKLEMACDELENAALELRSVQEEYETWKDSLPENLQSSALGEKLDAVCELEIENMHDSVRDAIDNARSVVEDADAIELPLGFGRD